jgi:TRAP-type C4-dicarboxylate transport system permease small subunit
MRLVAIVLIVLGIVGLIYGGITYTQRTHDAKIGPIDISVNENKTVPIPVWAGVGAIVVGGLLLFTGGRS